MSNRPATSAALPERKSISLELTNICNLRCSYCMRDEDALYHTPANFFPVELLRRIIRSAKRPECGFNSISFTGGEVTIHPRFREIVEAVREEGWHFSFVTNGWHFDRVYPVLLENRAALNVVAFSLDGATREAHDFWRGEGSFVRVVRAMTRCKMRGLPFIVKAPIRRDTVAHLQEFALFSARMGARALHFSHLLPTSSGAEDESGLPVEERQHAEQEIAVLSNIFKMEIGVAAGYYNLSPESPCNALSDRSANVDYLGRLSLCCNLSGYRGAAAETDVVADLTKEEFADGYVRLRRLAEAQLERRRLMLAEYARRGERPGLRDGSPCLFCLQSFGKIPWSAASGQPQPPSARALPVLPAPSDTAPAVFLKQESV
jgi:MoaA/NifB/PqqE/SkfB family radical SAM enzyme